MLFVYWLDDCKMQLVMQLLQVPVGCQLINCLLGKSSGKAPGLWWSPHSVDKIYVDLGWCSQLPLSKCSHLKHGSLYSVPGWCSLELETEQPLNSVQGCCEQLELVSLCSALG